VLAYIIFLFTKVRNNYLFLHFLPYKYGILPVHVFIGDVGDDVYANCEAAAVRNAAVTKVLSALETIKEFLSVFLMIIK
jgi:hypothetical protein